MFRVNSLVTAITRFITLASALENQLPKLETSPTLAGFSHLCASTCYQTTTQHQEKQPLTESFKLLGHSAGGSGLDFLGGELKKNKTNHLTF